MGQKVVPHGACQRSGGEKEVWAASVGASKMPSANLKDARRPPGAVLDKGRAPFRESGCIALSTGSKPKSLSQYSARVSVTTAQWCRRVAITLDSDETVCAPSVQGLLRGSMISRYRCL